MDNAIFERLVKWDKVLYNAVHKSFIHLSASEFGEIAAIYDEYFDTPLTKAQRNCNSCRLTALKKIGGEYEKEKQLREEGKTETPKKRVGRPRKIDLDSAEL